MNIIDKTIRNMIVISYKVCIKINNDDPQTTSKMTLGLTLFLDMDLLILIVMESNFLPIRSMSDLPFLILIISNLLIAQLFVNIRYFKDVKLLEYYKKESLKTPVLRNNEIIYQLVFILHPYILIISLYTIVPL